MHVIRTTAPLLLVLLAGAAKAPAATPASASPPAQTCYAEPAGPVFIGIGEVEVFYGDGCAGHTMTISPADGTAGFSSGTGCSKTSVTSSYGLFKVRGCETGSVTVSIHNGGTLVQTIYIDVGVPAE